MIGWLLAVSLHVQAAAERQFDTYDIEREGHYSAVLTYRNDAASMSLPGKFEISDGDDLHCTVHVTVSQGPETVSVYCTDGWDVQPRVLVLEDGEIGEFLLLYQAF